MKNGYAWLVMGALVLTACAETTTRWPEKTSSSIQITPSADPADAGLTLRIIVSFRDTVDFRSEAVLQMLQKHTQARRVAFVSSVHDNTHVYLFDAAHGQTQAQLLQALQKLPLIRYAEIDRIARAKQ